MKNEKITCAVCGKPAKVSVFSHDGKHYCDGCKTRTTATISCSYCGTKVAIYFAAYGKHSCDNPICRVQHEADGVAYWQSLGKTARKFPSNHKIVPKRDNEIVDITDLLFGRHD